MPPRSRPPATRAHLRTTAYAVLVGFHLVLLVQRIADATILEPLVLARYAGALALLAAARIGMRMAAPHLRGRRVQTVFWLIVLLLHAVAPVSDDPHLAQREAVEILGLALLAPAGVAIAHVAARLVREPEVIGRPVSWRSPAPLFHFRTPLSPRAPPFAR